MKNIIKATVRVAAIMVTTLCAASAVNAQVIPNSYVNIDWQVSMPVSGDFVDNTSGWGANFEAGYFLEGTQFAFGGFIAFHTNNEYKNAELFDVGTDGNLYTDQQHSIYRLPFGISARYHLNDGSGVITPYVALKLGPQFARIRSFYGQYESYDNTWGFYVSPEIGATIWPSNPHTVGVHIAMYYDYGTNSTYMTGYSVDNLSNFGMRLGVQF